ncbi:MAG: hypothetical protein HZA15_14335 [Nitrospirae bacterium]|nr:hypothetical protein [Nitrospirota bacterium]
MKARKEMVAMGTKIGAALGGIAFLAFGALPGFFFGSYGTLLVLKHLMGGPVEPTVIVRMAVAVGTLLGVVCIGSASIVLGSVIGTGIGYAIEAVSAPVSAKETSEAAAKTG